MKRTVEVNGKTIEYDLQIKKVKNINLRIHHDGEITVSASRWVSKKAIDNFVLSKAELIDRAIRKCAERNEKPRVQYYDTEELQELITNLCKDVFPYFEKKGVEFPVIKFRKMVSQWGNCYPTKRVLTFNTNLVYAPIECIEYVVMHEFTHFLQANHSPLFYAELEKICPDYKSRRKKLKEINIRTL